MNLENVEVRSEATSDPRGLLLRLSEKPGAIIDEAQYAPDIFSYVQELIDEGEGFFVLTGSQNFLLSSKISQSLAGRIGVLSLLPLAQSEIEGRSSREPQKILCRLTAVRPDVPLYERIYTGMYPEAQSENVNPDSWFGSYVQTFIERDVRTLANIGDLGLFHDFLRLCAGRSGQLLNIASLASDVGINVRTVNRWLSVLEASYIVMRLRPYHKNYSKRIVKASKLFFTDPGLMCHLLGIGGQEQIHTHPLRGAIFETFVFSELIKIFYNAGVRPRIHFWRDSHGNEVDFLIEQGPGLIPVEVKSSLTLMKDAFSGLEKFNKISGGKGGVLAYAGDQTGKRYGFDLWPWFAIS